MLNAHYCLPCKGLFIMSRSQLSIPSVFTITFQYSISIHDHISVFHQYLRSHFNTPSVFTIIFQYSISIHDHISVSFQYFTITFQYSIMIHEVGHALGLRHEQQRFDRDTYITVNQDNVNAIFWPSNYEMATEEDIFTYDIPYDYASTMHYGVEVSCS